MKELLMDNGMVSLVDDEDFEFLSQFHWKATPRHNGRTSQHWYAEVRLYIHRFLLDAPPGVLVDHKNGNTLDNRKENLRLCSVEQNRRNSQKRGSVTTSRYKGVSWSKTAKKWTMQIQNGRMPRKAAFFDNEEDAARAYDVAARELFGEFARTNF